MRPAGSDQSLNLRPPVAVTLGPSLVALLKPPLAQLRRRPGQDVPSIAGETFRLEDQQAPAQTVADFRLEPAVLLVIDPPPAADQRLVADVDRRLVIDRLRSRKA